MEQIATIHYEAVPRNTNAAEFVKLNFYEKIVVSVNVVISQTDLNPTIESVINPVNWEKEKLILVTTSRLRYAKIIKSLRTDLKNISKSKKISQTQFTFFCSFLERYILQNMGYQKDPELQKIANINRDTVKYGARKFTEISAIYRKDEAFKKLLNKSTKIIESYGIHPPHI